MAFEDIITAILLLTGTFFMFVAALGLLRLPDLYMRMSATTKSATLGVSFTLLASALHFEDIGIVNRSLATIVFLGLTAPVAAHLIGRAAYIRGVKYWEHTHTDELKGQYDLEKNELKSQPPVRQKPAPTATKSAE